MGRIEGDLEKGEADGTADALGVIVAVAERFMEQYARHRIPVLHSILLHSGKYRGLRLGVPAESTRKDYDRIDVTEVEHDT